MGEVFHRRKFLAAGVAAAGAGLAPPSAATGAPARIPFTEDPFTYCLNTSTIRGRELSLTEEIEVAAKAGYDAIEPWMGKIAKYKEGGGSLTDIAHVCVDHNLQVASAIGFAHWIVDDDARRKEGLEQARLDMADLRQMGATHVAAPPIGAHQGDALDLSAITDRYRDLLDVGREAGVVPQLEVWGFSANLSRLADVLQVAASADHEDACLLPDVYHLYKGGSGFAGLKLLGPGAVHCFHINDYPADPPRETIGDGDRVYPGDGVAPLDKILRTLADNGVHCTLSLELFNREYWEQDPLAVAMTGMLKMKAAVAKALDFGTHG